MPTLQPCQGCHNGSALALFASRMPAFIGRAQNAHELVKQGPKDGPHNWPGLEAAKQLVICRCGLQVL